MRRTVLAVLLAGCLTGCTATSQETAGRTAVTGSPSAAPAPTATATLPPLPGRAAPATRFAVGARTLALSRGPDRPLPTTLWYPAGGAFGGPARPGAPPASGRFPLVILSHGLGGSPEFYAPIGTRWAAAGFVVAAPAYPHTKNGAGDF